MYAALCCLSKKSCPADVSVPDSGSAREEATKVVEAEGVLLVLCSQVDNMPYVVAEAAVSPAAAT